jgi:hypothetical protein
MKRSMVVLMAGVILAVSLITVSVASSHTEYAACLDDKGNLTSVAEGADPMKPCKADAHIVTWGVEGPEGPQGSDGPVGPQGPAVDTSELEARLAALEEPVATCFLVSGGEYSSNPSGDVFAVFSAEWANMDVGIQELIPGPPTFASGTAIFHPDRVAGTSTGNWRWTDTGEASLGRSTGQGQVSYYVGTGPILNHTIASLTIGEVDCF